MAKVDLAKDALPEAEGASYRLVILDFDGTLADSAGWFAGVLGDVARRYRFRAPGRDEWDAMRAEDTAAMLRRLGVARWKLPFIARHMRGLMARDIAAIAPFPGVDRLLAALGEAGVAVAVVSSNAEGNARAVLGPDLCARVGRFSCGASLFGKAAKMRRLVASSGLPPAAVLAVGDEIRDIDAAAAAGLAVAAVTWGYAGAAALRARGPTFAVDTMDELIAVATGRVAGGAPP